MNNLTVLKYERFYRLENLPLKNKKEIAFIGKSNVGKSSLLNAILNNKINRVSKTPGCTKWIGYIELPNLVLIDLPGYGYAKVSKSRIHFWEQMIINYVNSKRIDYAFQLIDSRRGVQDIDLEIDRVFSHLSMQTIFTKCDLRESQKQNFGINFSILDNEKINYLKNLIFTI